MDFGIKTEREYHETITKIANIKNDGNRHNKKVNALVEEFKKHGFNINDFRDAYTFRNIFQ